MERKFGKAIDPETGAPVLIGYVTCPICGEEHQKLKKNKHGNLYVYCENGCATRYSPKYSRLYLEKLEQGEKQNENSKIEKQGGAAAGSEPSGTTSTGTAAGSEPSGTTSTGAAARTAIERRTDTSAAGSEPDRTFAGRLRSIWGTDDDL